MKLDTDYSFFEDAPAFTSLNAPDYHLTDIEFLRLATRISVKCKVEMNVEERDDSYRIEFYFKGFTLGTDFTDDFLHVLRASNMYVISVIKSKPETIKLTCYRTKS